VFLSKSDASSPGVFFTLESLASDVWLARGVTLQTELSPTSQALRISVQRFMHKSLSGELHGIDLVCQEIYRQEAVYKCPKGVLTIQKSPYGPQTLTIQGEFLDLEHFFLSVDGLKVADGHTAVELRMISGQWQLLFEAKQWALEVLRSQLPVEDFAQTWSLSGVSSFKANLTGNKDHIDHIKLKAGFEQLDFSDQEGWHVAEDGWFGLDIEATKDKDTWSGALDMQLKRGQLYSDPFYLEFSETPLSLILQGQWRPLKEYLQLNQVKLHLPQVLQMQGDGVIDFSKKQIRDANVDLMTDQLNNFYQTALQPLLIGTQMDEMDTSGRIEAGLTIRKGQLTDFQASLDQVFLKDQRGKFAWHDINGTLAWSAHKMVEPSKIQIAEGKLYQIEHGPFTVELQAAQDGLKLLRSVDIPVLGGYIDIDCFEAQGISNGMITWRTCAEVRNLALSMLARALGWPDMEGVVNGSLPAMTYQAKTLKLDGVVQLDVFGGRVMIDQLMVKQPMGRVPELFAAADFHHLDLSRITQTFSFGHIEGGLEGWVRNLHLMNWEPVAFQAQLQTPERDHLPHRISQRAVNHLTSLGNGVGGGLSNTFLGFFKEFRYNRMELSVKLEGTEAQLDGIDHPNGGYYLVKGAGLPRIDVIARNRRVAWQTLLARLKNIRVEGMEVR
jgi:hypothetical protein